MRVIAIKMERVWISKTIWQDLLTDVGYEELRGQSCQRCPQDLVPGRLVSGEVRGRDSKFIIFIC